MFLGVYMLLRVSAVIQDQRVVQALTLNFKEHFLRVWSKTFGLFLQFIVVCGHQHLINIRMQ